MQECSRTRKKENGREQPGSSKPTEEARPKKSVLLYCGFFWGVRPILSELYVLGEGRLGVPSQYEPPSGKEK